MARFSDAQLEQIRNRADIVSVVGDRVALERKGRDFVGRCPFHEEKTPSFYVTPAKQAWFCHGSCKKGGNVFKFVMESERVSFPEAVRLVAKRVGVAIEEETPEERARSQRRADLLETLQRAVDFYHRFLFEKKNDPMARMARELLERRGVKEETARAWKLGVAPAGSALLQTVMKRSPASVRHLREVGLLRDGQGGPRDFFHDRLLFPIRDEAGRPIAFGGRKLREEDEPKFLNSREIPGIFEKKRVLYGLDRARETKPRPERLVVVEGYLDVVISHQEGATNVVAALSTAFTREHALLAKRFVDGVTILFDGDKAGSASSRRILPEQVKELLDLQYDARIVSLPEGYDPDDFILKEGKEAFERFLRENARDPFEYLLDTALEGTDARHAPTALVAECAQLIALFEKNHVRRDQAIRQVFERLAIPEETLRAEVAKVQATLKRDARPQGQEWKPAERAIVIENASPQLVELLGPHSCAGEAFEVHLLEAFIARPDLARGMAAEVRADDFTRGPLREIASIVLRTARDEALGLTAGASLDELFLSRISQATAAAGPSVDGVVGRLLARIHEHPTKAWERELEGVSFLLRRRRKQRLEALAREVALANDRGDWDALERLLHEKTALEREESERQRAAAADDRQRAATTPPPHAESRPGGAIREAGGAEYGKTVATEPWADRDRDASNDGTGPR